MVVYPTADFNSWVSNGDADTIAQGYLNYPDWAALDADTQDRYLQQAFRTINGLSGFVGPVDPEDVGCLPTAQVEVALQDLKYGISTKTHPEGDPQTSSLTAGPTSISYYEQDGYVASSIPDESTACLESWGATFGNDSVFSSMRKIR